MALKFTNFDDIVNLMDDGNSLKILFYLREFNPNVTVDALVSNLSMSKIAVEGQLKNLMAFGIVENRNSLYQLSVDGRKLVNSFYHNLGEALPRDPRSEQRNLNEPR